MRMRQIREVIRERHAEQQKVRLITDENELQVLCSFIANTAPHPKTAKALISSVRKIRLFERPRRIPSVAEVEAAFGPGS